MFARVVSKKATFAHLFRAFSSSGEEKYNLGRVMTWGETSANIGRETNIDKPFALGIEGVKKVSMGRSHTAIVDSMAIC